MKTNLKRALMASALAALAACAPNNFQSLGQMAVNSTSVIGCNSFESKTWDSINDYLIEKKEIPSAIDVKQHLKVAMKDVKSARGSLTEDELNVLVEDMGNLYDLFLTEAVEKENVHTAAELLSVLAGLELGDHTTPSKVNLQNKVSERFAKMKADSRSLQVQCQAPSQAGNDTSSSPVNRNSALALPVFGANWTMATAYQSCEALSEPAMTIDTPNAQGIAIVGKHSDGVGNKREIASLGALLRTHPYYKNVSSYGSKCLNMRNSPLIYDYGGKPYVSATEGYKLNMFRDAGDGTSVLGIDCSGYIYSSLAAAGLRMAPGQNMKAMGVHGIQAVMYIEPQINNMSCLSKVTVRPDQSIKAGDIVAVPGHVLMIDAIGADPLGLSHARSVSDCGKLTSDNFNFVIIQSSNSKEGVGINRFEARDYLPGSPKMKASLERYAYYACLAKFNNTTYTPSLGTSSVVRHKLTPECLGTRVQLSDEACIQQCPQLTR